jgi:hypothetical protein
MKTKIIAVTILWSCYWAPKNFAQAAEPFQYWKSEKGAQVLAFFVNFASGAPFKAASIGEATITKDNQGFVTIQVPVSNSSRGRKTAKIRWEWKKANGMVARSPTGNALRMINIPGRDQHVIQSTSSVSNPSSVTLTFYPSK